MSLKIVYLYVIRTEFLYNVQNFVIAISVIRYKIRATSVQCENSGIHGTRLNFLTNYIRGCMLFLFSVDTFDHLKTKSRFEGVGGGGPDSPDPPPRTATEFSVE